jgi:hypothetical protein
MRPSGDPDGSPLPGATPVPRSSVSIVDLERMLSLTPARGKWGRDSNPRPSGYEPDELPDCSTPRRIRARLLVLAISDQSPDDASAHIGSGHCRATPSPARQNNRPRSAEWTRRGSNPNPVGPARLPGPVTVRRFRARVVDRPRAWTVSHRRPPAYLHAINSLRGPALCVRASRRWVPTRRSANPRLLSYRREGDRPQPTTRAAAGKVAQRRSTLPAAWRHLARCSGTSSD